MAETLSSKIYTEVRGDILNGVYSPRDFISESQIAKKYGVSKAPVKEAMHILADQGYLISYPRKGYMINTLSTEEINQIQVIRKTLEALCVELAIENATDQEIEALRAYNLEEQNSLDPRSTINTKFHIGLAKITGNPMMVETLAPLVNKASFIRIKEAPDTEHFDHIVDAMLKRDVEEAKRWIDLDISFL